LPGVQSLWQLDKVRLIQFVAQDLERQEDLAIEPGLNYPLPFAGPGVQRCDRASASARGRQGAAMNQPAPQFAYVPRDPSLGQASLAPMLPLTLIERQSVTTSGLLDSGAAVNVLPHALGLPWGFGRDQQTQRVQLSGNLAAADSPASVSDEASLLASQDRCPQAG
jgi:hypothetical protein